MARLLGAAAGLEQEPAALLGLVDEDSRAGSRSPRPRARRRACAPCACSRSAPCCRSSARAACRAASTKSSSLSLTRWSLAIWPIERMVVPPILRTRSARISTLASICVGLLVEQQMVVAEMRAADVPVEILGLHIERKGVGQQAVERRGNLLDGVVRQIGRRIQACGDPARFELSHLGAHGGTSCGVREGMTGTRSAR